jgi:ribulose-5-phosphate 4-epimerase/fuculose-1-phosphate aldolase
MGFTSPVSGNHSIRIQDKWMWITPSSIPRYTLKEKDLVKVHLESSKTGSSGSKPSIEWRMHVSIYDKLEGKCYCSYSQSLYTCCCYINR